MKFKIGDRVKVIEFIKDVSGYDPNHFINQIGIITEIIEEIYPYAVKFDDEATVLFAEDELDFEIPEESCDYCNVNNKEKDFKDGHDGVCWNLREKEWQLVINHFRGEWNRVEVKFCPQCGRKLELL